jgi:molybdate transport system ATP-binding protein
MSLPIPTLTFNAVTVSVGGRHILENVTWHLYKSHHYLLTGANGSGKSTLLKTLWDHDLITNGHISYPGFDGMRPIRDQIGYVSDELVKHIQKRSIQQSEYTSYSGMLHEENTYTTLTRDTPCDYAYLHTLIQEWDLDALMERPAHHLSTGQLQICLIVRALSKKPRLLILDEALEGLDESNRKRFNDVLVTASDHTQLICVAHHADDVLACLTDQLKIQAGVCICSPLIPQSTQATHIKKNISSPTPDLPKIASLVHVSVRHDDHIVLSDFSWDIHQFQLMCRFNNLFVDKNEFSHYNPRGLSQRFYIK